MWQWWIQLPWNVWLDYTDKIVRMAAVLIGGGWAYVRFVKGRTHFSRIEPTVAGRFVKKNGTEYLIANVHVKNIGVTKVNIEKEGTALRVLGAHGGGGRIEWTRLRTLAILSEYQWLEPSESIDDNVIIDVPNGLIAFRLEALLIIDKQRWRAKTIIEIPESPVIITEAS
jgi:hypothetical protein